MKWFFTITEERILSSDNGFVESVRAAVKSARDNTRLVPYMIFDGEECDFTREMREQGVTIFFHHLHYYDRLKKAYHHHSLEGVSPLDMAACSLLALEIPLLESEDNYILYTESTILFLRDPELEFCKPEIFAACGHSDPQAYFSDMSASVLVMNLKRMRNDLPAMVDFLCDNLFHIKGSVQNLLKIFYNGQWSPLSARFNWKPYWGLNDNAVILNFHGTHPLSARRLLEDASYREDDPSFQTWRMCFFRNPMAYGYYVPIWERFLSLSIESERRLIDIFDAEREKE